MTTTVVAGPEPSGFSTSKLTRYCVNTWGHDDDDDDEDDEGGDGHLVMLTRYCVNTWGHYDDDDDDEEEEEEEDEGGNVQQVLREHLRP